MSLLHSHDARTVNIFLVLLLSLLLLLLLLYHRMACVPFLFTCHII